MTHDTPIETFGGRPCPRFIYGGRGMSPIFSIAVSTSPSWAINSTIQIPSLPFSTILAFNRFSRKISDPFFKPRPGLIKQRHVWDCPSPFSLPLPLVPSPLQGEG